MTPRVLLGRCAAFGLAALMATAWGAGSGTRTASAAPKAAAAESPPRAGPEERNLSYYWDGFEQTVRPLTRACDPPTLILRLTGNPREAANVDASDQVRLPSTWWQPRVGYRPITVADMLAGPGPGTGPAPGKWMIVKAKTRGVSPGVQIKDSQGVRFSIKFDVPRYPELTTGAEVVATYLYWAAGYNVPDNAVVTFRREDLEIDPKAKLDDPLKGKIPMTSEYLDALLAKVARNGDGSYRAVASRFLAGQPLGEFKYSGVRRDDSEDMIPHQHRRELRGLWTINSWIHHDDCSSRNTLDMWVSEGGRSFVRHHLSDFNGTLGSASIDKYSYRS